MELDILYLQASTNIALFLLSVLGLYLNVSQFKTLTSITCCISKIALYPTTTFPCSRRSIFYLIFKLGLDIKSPVWLKSGFMVRLNFLDQNSTEFWLCSMVKLFTLGFFLFSFCMSIPVRSGPSSSPCGQCLHLSQCVGQTVGGQA